MKDLIKIEEHEANYDLSECPYQLIYTENWENLTFNEPECQSYLHEYQLWFELLHAAAIDIFDAMLIALVAFAFPFKIIMTMLFARLTGRHF